MNGTFIGRHLKCFKQVFCVEFERYPVFTILLHAFKVSITSGLLLYHAHLTCYFRYKENEDGFLRLQTIRYESIELTEEIIANKGKGNDLKMAHLW